ncbi:hypothetical protein IL306_004318 [Fusarium sp. DS 682]|nr:hypothetical protein IL306_004318 [Fusarium sp. DS 682]
MSRSAAVSTLLACLLARPVVGLAGWWTWSPYVLTPHFAYQDPGSGDILHSSCSSNGSASFSPKKPNKFPLKTLPKAATPLAASGWWDDELNTPIVSILQLQLGECPLMFQASIFYQNTDDAIVNAYLVCDNKTGNYRLDPDGESIVSDLAGLPSVHEKTGLAVAELGDSGGSRVYYHDEDGLLNLLAYDDDTDWRYDGPVSLKKTGGMAVAAVQTKGTNVSVVYPYDSKNMVVARYNNDNKSKWRLESFPTPFDSPAPTNATDPSDIRLDTSTAASLTLPSYDNSAVNLGIASQGKEEVTVFYIGKDSQLHAIAHKDGAWVEQKRAGKSKWPEADNSSARLAVVSPLESDQIWVYYTSGDEIKELHRSDGGSWDDAQTPKAADTDSEADGGDATGTGGSSGTKATETASSSSHPDTGMTAGAKAGIGVGVSVGVLAIAAGAFFFLRRRRQKTPGDTEHKESVGELATYHPVELATEVHEPQEMSATQNQHYELLGDTRRRP